MTPALLSDGTCYDFAPLRSVLADRQRYGHGYRENQLEAKRRAAVDWLRGSSRRGWVCDKNARRDKP
jgi:hypothetical protein